MKKLVLLLFASILLNLAFTSCDDEFGVKKLNIYFDFLILKDYKCNLLIKYSSNEYEDKISASYPENDKFIYTNNKGTKFLEHYDKNKELYDIFFWNDVGTQLQTRIDFQRKLIILVKGIVNNKLCEETIEYEINIPYLDETCTQYFDLSFETENFGNIYCLFSYDFKRFI